MPSGTSLFWRMANVNTEWAFKPEDFLPETVRETDPDLYNEIIYNRIDTPELFGIVASKIANARLREVLEREGQRVYKSNKEAAWWPVRFIDRPMSPFSDTHTGVVVLIEEIK